MEMHYDILSVKEDASYDEIRASYRSALLNFHPDKLRQQTSLPNHFESGDRFLKVQRAWEVLSSSKLRAAYDIDLQALRGDDAIVSEEISLEDMMVEDMELFYQCRCGDYFCINEEELAKMGYPLLRDGCKILLKTTIQCLSASVVLPCGSCSLKVRLLLKENSNHEKFT